MLDRLEIERRFKLLYQLEYLGNAKPINIVQPLVSVSVATYQHENFIRECLEGILMQKTNFPFEVVIGEDESKDTTRAICKEYAEKYPDKIRLFLRDRKLSVLNDSKGKIFKSLNGTFTLLSSRGKYIALCEGDDYWTDPLKLQKQVDFLEANADYNICFHKVKVLNNSAFTIDHITEKRFSKISNDKPTQLDLLEQGNFIHTTSVVFRNTVKEFPKAFYLTPIGDYFLHIILSSNGYIKRLDDVMGVYRSGVGIFSSLKKLEMNTNILKLQACVLSYLEDDDSKQVLLKKHLALIDHHNMIVNVNLINSKIAEQKSFKDLLKIFIYKLKYLYVKLKNKVS